MKWKLWNCWSGHSSVFLSEQAIYFCNEEQWWHDVRPSCSSPVFGFHGSVSQQCFTSLKALPWWQGKELSYVMAAPAPGWGWSWAREWWLFWKCFEDVALYLCLLPHLLLVARNPQPLEDYRLLLLLFFWPFLAFPLPSSLMKEPSSHLWSPHLVFSDAERE